MGYNGKLPTYTERLDLKLSLEEKNKIEANAKKLGFESVGAFIRFVMPKVNQLEIGTTNTTIEYKEQLKKRINITIGENERDILKEKASNMGFTNVSEYIRVVALNCKFIEIK